MFDSRQMLYDVSGSGNNWAHGYHAYGNKYRRATSSSGARDYRLDSKNHPPSVPVSLALAGSDHRPSRCCDP